MNRPKKLKKCTDTPWLCLFSIFLVFSLTIAVLSIVNGNYLAIINGYDTFGNICGTQHNTPFKNVSLSGYDTSEKPYVLYFGLENVANVMRICVNECPDNVYPDDYDLTAYWMLHKHKLCRYDFDMMKLVDFYYFINYKTSAGPCPKGTVLESYIIKQRCIPIHYEPEVAETFSVINSIFKISSLIFINVYLTWPYVVFLGGVALLICLMFGAIIWWQQKFCSWIICVSCLLANGGFGALLWHANANIYERVHGLSNLYHLLEEFQTNNRILYTAAVSNTITTILLTIVLVLVSKHISKSVILFNDAIFCLNQMKEVIIFPLVALLTFIGFVCFWTYVMLCMTTANNPRILPYTTEMDKDNLDRILDENYTVFTKVDYVEEESIRSLWWTYILGWIWTTEFIFGCEEFCLDASVSFWCFCHTNYSIKNVLKLLFRFHLGAVAKGSLLFPLSRASEIMLNACRKILSLIKFGVIEKLRQNIESFLKNIECFNHCLYAEVATEATDLCSAGKKTNLTIPPEVATINNVTKFILFLAKLTVADLTGIIAMLLLRRDSDDVFFYLAPVFFSRILAFYIAHVVLSLFEKIIDTTVFCAAEETQVFRIGGRLAQTKLAAFIKNGQVKIQQIGIQTVRIPVKPMPSEQAMST